MRSKDIRIGERYVACHCGATVIVMVNSIFRPSKEGEATCIVTTNHLTGERISFRNSMSFARPASPYIAEVKTIEDLFIGQKAFAEPTTNYRLRKVNEADCFAIVDLVVRRLDVLYARISSGEEYPITGEGACVLVPSHC